MREIYSGNLSPWQKVGERVVMMVTKFITAFTQIFKHPVTGAEYTFSQFEIGPHIVIMPITKEGNVVLTFQWKQGVEMVCPQFPGGAITSGASIQNVAASKLKEETGYEAETFEVMPGTYHFFDSRCPDGYQVVIARGARQGPREETPGAQVLSIWELSQREILEKMDRGEIFEPATYVAVYHAQRRGWLMG